MRERRKTRARVVRVRCVRRRRLSASSEKGNEQLRALVVVSLNQLRPGGRLTATDQIHDRELESWRLARPGVYFVA